ncbi:MAG: MFS transporter [Acetobacteraceae bacterium]|nr:MFS transporter [Acetobacteraceae bacterium]
MNGPRFIAWVVTAQVLAQLGAQALPALLPGVISAWSLSKTEAGWLVGVFFVGYVAAVPVLVSLTDRLPARNVYIFGAACAAIGQLGFAFIADGFWSGMAFRVLSGVGWAGNYMPGLKAIADTLEGDAQSRAISWHAAGSGIAGASSFAIAGALDAQAGPQAAFLFGGIAAIGSGIVAFCVMACASPIHARTKMPRGLLDFRPVFRNRRAMAWIAGYTVHTWELAALRAWGVTFLTATAARGGAPAWLPAPTVLMTMIGLICIGVSVTGNEIAQRLGRARVVTLAMSSAALFSLITGWAIGLPILLATALVLIWNACTYIDSSALTAGTVQAADKDLRGATMGLHSMCGYTGGFLGPLGVGIFLDLAGDNAALGWGLGFGHLALVTLLGLTVLRRLGQFAGH